MTRFLVKLPLRRPSSGRRMPFRGVKKVASTVVARLVAEIVVRRNGLWPKG